MYKIEVNYILKYWEKMIIYTYLNTCTTHKVNYAK